MVPTAYEIKCKFDRITFKDFLNLPQNFLLFRLPTTIHPIRQKSRHTVTHDVPPKLQVFSWLYPFSHFFLPVDLIPAVKILPLPCLVQISISLWIPSISLWQNEFFICHMMSLFYIPAKTYISFILKQLRVICTFVSLNRHFLHSFFYSLWNYKTNCSKVPKNKAKIILKDCTLKSIMSYRIFPVFGFNATSPFPAQVPKLLLKIK